MWKEWFNLDYRGSPLNEEGLYTCLIKRGISYFPIKEDASNTKLLNEGVK
jgi:hypothetical protein